MKTLIPSMPFNSSAIGVDYRRLKFVLPVLIFAFIALSGITAQAQNNAPVVGDQAFTIDENTANSTSVGTVVASDPDLGDILTYDITAGNTNSAFFIDGSTGEITVNNSVEVDYEVHTAFSLTVEVTDNGTPNRTTAATVTVNINNLNEVPSLLDQTFTIPSNSYNGTIIGNMVANDQDGDTLIYVLLNDSLSGVVFSNIDFSGPVAFNGSNGELEIQDSTAFTTVGDTITLVLGVIEINTPDSLTAIATGYVIVTQGNQWPAIAPQTLTVDENTPAAFFMGNVNATDPDAGDSLFYILESGNTDNAFSLDFYTGGIAVNNSAALNHEVNPSFDLIISVMDNGYPSRSTTGLVRINVLDVNEAPVIDDQTLSVAENSPNTTSVGTVVVTEVDPGKTLTYSITGGTGASVFSIDGSTGEITVVDSASLDYETITSFTVIVEIVDDSSLTDNATVTINVTDANDSPSLADATLSVDENSANTTVVGTVTATDPDAGASFTYTITGGNASGIFAIGSTSGTITVADNSSLDYELATSHSLTVQVSDGSATDDATITVNVGDVNESPVIANQAFSVTENSANNTVVGTVVASDPDAGDVLSYAITGGNTGSAFKINATTGQISVNSSAALDFETTPSFTLVVTATDNDGSPLTSQANVTITLIDANDAPVASNATFTVDENANNGVAVGTVSATDQDAGQTLSYAITGGNTGNVFAINSASGEITVAGAIDFETLGSYTLTVTVTDDGTGNLTDNATITINVNDVNEAPVLPDFTFEVDEMAANGTYVGKVGGQDQDGGQTLSYTITAGNANGEFALDPSTGFITVNNGSLLDFEGTVTYTFTVTATDDGTGNLTDDATVTINLLNVNEQPSFSDITFNVNENTPSNTLIDVLQGSDIDAGDVLSYTIVSGNIQAFTLEASTGKLKVNDASWLDYETTTSFQLVVEVKDDGKPALSTTGTVTINILDVNEAPVMSDATFSVDENSGTNTSVGFIPATDPDAWQTVTYSIVSGNDLGAFFIKPSTGELVVVGTGALDYETTTSFTIVVRGTDDGWPEAHTDVTVTVNVNDVNEAPVMPDFTFNVAENSPNGTIVGTISGTDVDAGQTLSYTLTGLGSTAFSMNPANGIVKVADESLLNYEVTNSTTLTAEATDNGNPALSVQATITINITDVNEAPTVTDVVKATDEDVILGFTPSDFIFAYNDVDGNQLDKIRVLSLPSNGALTLAGQMVGKGDEIAVGSLGDLEYKPNGNYNGMDLFEWNANDGSAYADNKARVDITINPVNDVPTVIGAIADITVDEDAATIGSHVDLTNIFDDVEHGSALGFRLESNSNPSLADITITNGKVAVDFRENAYGTATVALTGTDFVHEATTSFTITVNPIDDLPGAFDLIGPLTGSTIELDALTNIEFDWSTSADVDNDGINYTLHVTGNNLNLSYDNLTSTDHVINGDGVFEAGMTYNWYVTADDGQTVINSDNTFGFKIAEEEVSTAVIDLGNIEGFELISSYPNPFTNSTTIGYVLPKDMNVTVKVFNSIGEEIITLVDDKQPAGEHKITWGGQDAGSRTVSAGKYIYQVTVTDLSGKEVAQRSGKMLKF